MSLKNILVDAVGAYLSQAILNRGLNLSGIEAGRYPKWILPIIIPKGAVPEGEAPGEVRPILDLPFRVTTLGFSLGFAGFLLYAAREMDRARLSGLSAAEQMELDLSPRGDHPTVEITYIGEGKGDDKWGIDLVNISEEQELSDQSGGRYRWHTESDSAAWAHQKAEQMATYAWELTGRSPEIIWMHHYDEEGHIVDNEGNILDLGKEMSEFWKPEQPELFKAKRVLSLEMEDISKSEDPIFACMERRGYKQKQMDLLTEKIAEKATVDMFDDEPKKLTSTESKFQDDMQECIEQVIKVFGSLEAAGYESEDCDCAD